MFGGTLINTTTAFIITPAGSEFNQDFVMVGSYFDSSSYFCRFAF